MAGLSSIGIPLAFAFPWALLALITLPAIWWLLRLTPPRPVSEPFPPTKILSHLIKREETPARSPWWLTLLRLLMAALAIFAMALPVWNPEKASLEGEGPLLLIVDNGWASGEKWEAHIASANQIIDEAESARRPVLVIKTVQTEPGTPQITPTGQLRNEISSWKNYPVEPDYQKTAILVNEANAKYSPTSVVFLSDGMQYDGARDLSIALQATAKQQVLYLPDTNKTVVINSLKNDPGAMSGNITRANSSGPAAFNITALDINGVSVARQVIQFSTDETIREFKFEIPVELRNDVVRVIVDNVKNAGAVRLLDESNRRRLVGLISGEKHDNSQPLLSPLFYISRALEPFSDIRRANDANVVKAVPDLITTGVSAIILADIGLIPPKTSDNLQAWVNGGGMLIRFAGPRLAASPNNTLLPVRIREGNRNIGGALSWEEPKPVAEFELSSPFFGLEPPREVFVSRQVLALQEGDLTNKTWARLTDGTPLVTASRIGEGWVVLFHVSSDARWSNLPISGTFVEMLRRVVNQSHSRLGADNDKQAANLPPLRLLNGKGQLDAPDIKAKPVSFNGPNPPSVSVENPPGFYGTSDGFRALNLFGPDTKLTLLSDKFLGENTTLANYGERSAFALKPWLLLLMATFLVFDCIAVLWMAGAFRFLLPRTASAHTAALLIALSLAIVALSPGNSIAQENTNDEIDFSPALQTRLAYVITGISRVDETSEAGLRGLTNFLTQRTAIEPGEPIGVDISTDELAFYPIIYWPIHQASAIPDNATMARIDAYMKQGGSVLFDTQDQVSGFLGGTSASPQALHLQEILANLDIPPLEPVPSDHVLTKSFFILAQFPGRYSGGELWVEQLPDVKEYEERPVRSGDGVSSILITSNDLAGAWAINAQSQPMFAIVPPNPIQREMAFRVGVNLIMYAMTGNYKADQVHIPALLERLGQ